MGSSRAGAGGTSAGFREPCFVGRGFFGAGILSRSLAGPVAVQRSQGAPPAGCLMQLLNILLSAGKSENSNAIWLTA